jgi:hypothetical protein
MERRSQMWFESVFFIGLLGLLLFAGRGRADIDFHTVNNGVFPQEVSQGSMPRMRKHASTAAADSFLESAPGSVAIKP